MQHCHLWETSTKMLCVTGYTIYYKSKMIKRRTKLTLWGYYETLQSNLWQWRPYKNIKNRLNTHERKVLQTIFGPVTKGDDYKFCSMKGQQKRPKLSSEGQPDWRRLRGRPKLQWLENVEDWSDYIEKCCWRPLSAESFGGHGSGNPVSP